MSIENEAFVAEDEFIKRVNLFRLAMLAATLVLAFVAAGAAGRYVFVHVFLRVVHWSSGIAVGLFACMAFGALLAVGVLVRRVVLSARGPAWASEIAARHGVPAEPLTDLLTFLR